MTIEQLGADGDFVAAESSRFLRVRPDEVTRWVVHEKSSNRRQWTAHLGTWIRTELKPHVEAEQTRT